VPIFIFCFSVASFAAVYENKIFPDLPEDLGDVVVIYHSPGLGGYRLYTCDDVDYYSDRLWFHSGQNSTVDEYVWKPSTSDEWELTYSSSNTTLYVWYKKGEDDFYYTENGNHRLTLLYSNVDIEEDGGDFFFKATPFLTSTILQLPFIHLYWKIMTNLVGGMLCGVGLKIFGIVLAIFLVRRCLRYFL
jgi:hypothetical protein